MTMQTVPERIHEDFKEIQAEFYAGLFFQFSYKRRAGAS